MVRMSEAIRCSSIPIEAEISGPATATEARLVLDTGAAATTLAPEVIERIGYTRDSFKKARVHTAVREENGYWIRVAEFTALALRPLTSRSRCSLLGTRTRRIGRNELPPTPQFRDQARRASYPRRADHP